MELQHVQTAVAGLKYDWRHFTMSHFIEHIQILRQRPLELYGWPLYDYSGLCLATDRIDYVFYNSDFHPHLQIHTKLHEIAHLILGHTRILDLNRATDIGKLLVYVKSRVMLIADNDPAIKQEEDEAEYFAILIQGHIATHRRLHELTMTDRARDIYMPPFTGHTKGTE